jgi:hypothetical protein
MTVRYEANKPVSTYWTSLLRQCSRTNVREQMLLDQRSQRRTRGGRCGACQGANGAYWTPTDITALLSHLLSRLGRASASGSGQNSARGCGRAQRLKRACILAPVRCCLVGWPTASPTRWGVALTANPAAHAVGIAVSAYHEASFRGL